jgi:hypothetical protein
MYHNGHALIDSDTQQAGMRGDNLVEVFLAATRIDVLIDGRIGEQPEGADPQLVD